MKTMKNSIWTVLVVVMAALMSSCSKVPKYTKLIPSDASVVVRVDVKQGMESTGLDENSEMKGKLKKMLKDSGDSKKTIQLLTDIIDDPMKLGLDLRDPLFFYLNSDSQPALIGAVYDADNFTKVLNTFAKESDGEKVREKDGYYTMVSNNDVLVYDKNWFYLGHKKYNQDEDDFIDDVKDMFEAKETKNTMLDSENMKSMCVADGFVQTLVQLEGFSNNRNFKQLEKQMPDGLNLEDISILMDFNIKDEMSTLSAEILTQNEDWKKEISRVDDEMKEISDDMLSYISEEGAAMAMSIDFQKCLEQDEDIIKDILKELNSDERAIVKKTLEAIVGEAVLAWNGWDPDYEYPKLAAYAKMSDSNFMREIDDRIGSNLTSEGKYQYSTPIAYGKRMDPYWGFETTDYNDPRAYSFFGYEKDMFYCVTGEKSTAFNKAKKALSSSMLKGKGFFAYMSVKVFDEFTKKMDDNEADFAKKFFNLFKYAEAYYEGNGKFVVQLHAKDKDFISDIIKSFTKFYEEIQSRQNDAADDVQYEEVDTCAVDVDDYGYAVDSVAVYDEY